MNDIQFQRYYDLIYQNLGIKIIPAKRGMLQAKLDKLLRLRNLSSYELYYDLLTKDPNRQYWAEFVNEITVHQSSFFRENSHFEYIRSQLRIIMETNPRILNNNEIRVWSAGCSTGEEPYTLAMVLKEWLAEEIDIQIVATDISNHTLAFAQNGLYPSSIKKDMDPYYLTQYFKQSAEKFVIIPKIKELVTFRLFNLMDPFPFQKKFDLIFCRNVMIYFDSEIQQQLIEKFYEVLAPGGLLFIGHSESLLNKEHEFKYVNPTIYQKKGNYAKEAGESW